MRRLDTLLAATITAGSLSICLLAAGMTYRTRADPQAASPAAALLLYGATLGGVSLGLSGVAIGASYRRADYGLGRSDDQKRVA